jgi:hypothetical protein
MKIGEGMTSWFIVSPCFPCNAVQELLLGCHETYFIARIMAKLYTGEGTLGCWRRKILKEMMDRKKTRRGL